MSLPEPPTVPRCYRHPDREGGRSCTRCGKPACADCLVQAAIGSHCLDCAKAARPDVKTRAKLASSRVLTPVTYTIIGLNLLVFLWMAITDTSTFRNGLTRLHLDYGLSAVTMQTQGEWYRLLTSGFVHFGILHLVLNMYALFNLGALVEKSSTPLKTVLLYTAGLFGGSFGALLVEGNRFTITAGASGAVLGLFGAAVVGLRRDGFDVFSTSIGTSLLAIMYLTFRVDGISIGGHLGGLVAGGICGFVMFPPRWKVYPKWLAIATPVAVTVVSIIGSIVYVKSLTFR